MSKEPLNEAQLTTLASAVRYLRSVQQRWVKHFIVDLANERIVDTRTSASPTRATTPGTDSDASKEH